LLAVLGGIIALQQHAITDFEERSADMEHRLARVEAALESRNSAISLLTKFVANNHKKINAYQAKRRLTVTAYSPEPSQTDDTPLHTATNNRVRPGIVAVSRDLFDNGWVFGKKVYIKGLGVFVIDDLMARRKKNQLDIFMPDTGKARNFGRQKRDVYLLEEA
jgi:3D (Asp-Asp-Asp) domain-containing protein